MCLAIPGKITQIEGDVPMTRMGKVDFSGIRKNVSLAYVPEASIGDYVLVHVGFALQTIDKSEAEKTLSYIRELGALEELEQDDTSKKAHDEIH